MTPAGVPRGLAAGRVPRRLAAGRVPRRLAAGLERAAASASENAVATGYVSGWRLVRLLPEPAALSLFAGLADQISRRNGKGVRRLRANLMRVRPEADLDQLTRLAVRSYLRYWCESFRLPSWPTPDLVNRTRTIGEARFREAHASGRGVVVALPHMANWDWAGAWACATGMPVCTVAERLRPERLYDEFVAYRAGLGMEILPLTGGKETFERLEEWATAGGLVCLLADRDLGSTGVEVELCGHKARMPRGPALIARRTGAALIPATLAYRDRDLEVTFHPEVAHATGAQGTTTMMQGVADVFTRGLRTDPQDWHMMQKVFVTDPVGG